MAKMTEEWVLLWRQCLFENMDYQKYCIHCDADDEEEEKAALESKFPLIAEIYEDFGYERPWPKMGVADPAWREWFEPRRHLFMSNIKRLEAGDTVLQEDGHITLHIPLQSRLEATAEDLMAFLSPLYETAAHKPHPEPKYKLNLKEDGRVAIGYEEVRQAVITSTDGELFDAFAAGHRQSIKTAQVEFLRRKLNDLGWSFGVREKKMLIETGYLDDESYERFKTQINRARRLFKFLSANAIDTRFPKKDLVYSESWDYFHNKPVSPGEN